MIGKAMDTRRLVLFFVFSFSLILLWEAWQKDERARQAPAPTRAADAKSPESGAGVPAPATARPGAAIAESPGLTATKGELIEIRTDLYVARFSTIGATLERLELLGHRDVNDAQKNLVLLGPEHRYVAQSGLTGDAGPHHRSLWTAKPAERSLAPSQSELKLEFEAEGPQGSRVSKSFTFRRDSYLIDAAIEVRNPAGAPVQTHAYFQLTHDGRAPAGGNSLAQSFGAQSFLGFSAYTAERKFEKVEFSDIDKGKAAYAREARDGWLAFVQHYFVSAWLPADGDAREYVIEKRPDSTYVGRVLVPLGAIAAGTAGRAMVQLYAGPQEQKRLKAAASGLDLVVDYGWLTVIAWPLFWLLEQFFLLSGNWGVAIILLTLSIKLVFYPLSAASYRSMAKMKVIAPRLTRLREMHGNDRGKLNQAMMDLYKTEKINPLGGCFPILVQIPVFIALYWVLLAAIELRHAPFVLWIRDLSALDPYYVLPSLMAVTMVVQTRLNPKPPDPVQAKVMAVMPYVFSIFFFFFPAGLVLYWLVNNILSILQQWYIQRAFDTDRTAVMKR